MHTSQLTAPVRSFTALLLCGTFSMAALAMAASAGHTPARAAAPPAFPPAVQRQFQQALDQAVADPNVPGAIVGIWVPGRGTWIHAAGLADRATKRPVQVGDYTRIGSITKMFIGTLILQLAGEGRLGLDEPIQRWAPEVPNAQHTTVRELLNMSSGLYNYTEDKQWDRHALAPTGQGRARQWAPEQLVRVTIAHKPYFPPGQGFHYSNTNTILLSLIIEQITSRPVQAVLRTRILQPRGLTHTVFPATTAMPSPHLHGYSVNGGALTEVNTTANVSWGWMAGAMISTLADLHTWAQAVATGRLLSPALQKQRLTWSPPSVAYFRQRGVAGGYGLAIAKLKGFIGHTGELPAFNTDAWYLPALQATIVVIVNSGSPDVPVQVPAAHAPADHLTQQLVKILSALPRAA